MGELFEFLGYEGGEGRVGLVIFEFSRLAGLREGRRGVGDGLAGGMGRGCSGGERERIMGMR